MNYSDFSQEELREIIIKNVNRYYGEKIEEAGDSEIYRAVCMVIRDILTAARAEFKSSESAESGKRLYYMSMEFLLGRSLRNHLFNMGLEEKMAGAVKSLGFDLNKLYEIEPDAALGNGGLGRLAAAYLDSLTSLGYVATGFSIMYDYGIFKQKIVDGYQVELPDDWLPNGSVWLRPDVQDTFEVHFGGVVDQTWEDGKLVINHHDYTAVLAVAYDMNISGTKEGVVNRLRLWSSRASSDFDMALFSKGEYMKAMESRMMAESISKLLYPADDHIEGKSLRLKQQYFFVSASMQSIVKRHLKTNPNLDNLAEQAAIHINDTHPTLCIPELMRILLDEHGYGWDDAWKIVCETVSYTNHTIMAEALEKWPQTLFSELLPRIYQIVCEINRRYCEELWSAYPSDNMKVADNAILSHGLINMANICLVASKTINGVSALHSEILKNRIFKNYHDRHPQKFTSVTNGITHRRWVCQANPGLAKLLCDTIGDGWIADASQLSRFKDFGGDDAVLERLRSVKRENKLRLADYILKNNGVAVNPDSIFDCQAKRLHEYKRQLLNALNILNTYFDIKDNAVPDDPPRTYIFAAKAASSYVMAKNIIRLIWQLGEVINSDPAVGDRLKVVFLENYRVSLSEIMMPAAEISEQISLAGMEASGTGNMKFMINGAVTVGTMDGANIEIKDAVGTGNMFIFGMKAEEVQALRRQGYDSTRYYASDPRVKRVIDALRQGIGGVKFNEIADNLLIGNGSSPDKYMCLADFDSYAKIQKLSGRTWQDTRRFDQMSLANIAGAGYFSADRAVKEYAERIWNIHPVQ